MRILMLGWEFPPFISGGLGTACYGLTRGLDKLGTEVLFVLPRPIDRSHATHVRILAPGAKGTGALDDAFVLPGHEFVHTRFRTVTANIQPYASPAPGGVTTSTTLRSTSAASGKQDIASPLDAGDPGSLATPIVPLGGPGEHYAGDLFAEVARYRHHVRVLARDAEFDVIHAHDWMTYPAGMAVSAATGKPLVIHVHSTEFDRSGEHVNQAIYDIERAGMHAARRVICVSYLTHNLVVNRYGVDPRKVTVVYNAIDNGEQASRQYPPIRRDEKIVLFLGRITMQKGPEYFLQAARRVLKIMENVRFVMAGSGDMIRRIIEMAAEMGIGHKVLFTGFLRGEDVKRIYRMADLYVMPSVSEPFGIAPLEAISNDVPVLISKQSGVAEVLTHALKVDFWDIDEMANKILAVLRHPPLQATLRQHGSIEVRSFSWTDSARQCVHVYEQALAG